MRLAIAPASIELRPGADAELHVTIVNDGEEPLAPTLTVTGLDPSLITLPDDLAVLAPEGVASAIVGIRLPEAQAAGQQRIGVSVSDQDGLQRPATSTATIHVGARPDVTVGLEPSVTSGRRAAHLVAQLHNRGAGPVDVQLTGYGEGVVVDFLDHEVVLAPGEDRDLPTRVTPVERSWFREKRHGALIEVQGRGAPVTATTTFVQRPLIPPLLLRLVAMVTVLAVWAAATVVVKTQVIDAPAETQKTWAASPELVAVLAAGGDGTGTGDEAEGDADGVGPPIVVEGTITGPTDPVGTRIVIEQIGFGDEGTTSGSGETKLAAFTPVARPVGAVLGRVETSTNERGTFRVSSGLVEPAFYRVTAMHPGFEVGSQVVATSKEAHEVGVDIALVPASGAMSGRVTDEGGAALREAEITVTDGQMSYTARSTDGGSWALSGLATPATYQVIVSHHGHATATLLVDLAGGQQRSGVDARLRSGMGAIRARTVSEGRGVGAVTVGLSGEGIERATTTLTGDQVGSGLVGGFSFPPLPYGTYQLTFSADGFLPQTAEVVVDRGLVEPRISDLIRSTGTLRGLVEQDVVRGSDCLYPDPTRRRTADGIEAQPCGNVGVTVVGVDNEWRTTTTTEPTVDASGTANNFSMSGLPVGEYSVRFERYGYVSEHLSMVVEPGDRLRLPDERGTIRLRLSSLARGGVTVTGQVRDATRPAATFVDPEVIEIVLDGQGPDGRGTVRATPDAEGRFTLERISPGAHTLRIVAPNYEPFSQVIRVPSDGSLDLGRLLITPLASLALRVTGGQASVVGDADVIVIPDPLVHPPGTEPIVELSAGVTECTRTITLDGVSRQFEGVCATTNAVGDLEFRRNFPTGSYVFAVPVNATDLAETLPARRATTVPLDHEMLVRRVDLVAGQTVRLDPNLRRYPIVTGTIRRVSEQGGLVPVSFTREDVSFVRLDPDTGNPFYADGEDPVPLPRISATGDPDSTLGPGQYRIDRIPADDNDEQYMWELSIRTSHGTFARRYGGTEGKDPIVGLGFNETRTINGLVLPNEEPLRIVTEWENANGVRSGVPDALVRLRGTFDFELLDQAPFYQPAVTTCPSIEGEDPYRCEAPNVFSYTVAMPPAGPTFAPPVVRRSVPGTTIEYWLSAALQGGPAGSFDMPAFFRPGAVFVDLAAEGFAPELVPADDPEPTFHLSTPDPDDQPFTYTHTMRPLPRLVTGSVNLRPAGASYPDFLAQDALGNLTGDGSILAGLTVELALTREDGSTQTFPATSYADGAFTFAGVVPGDYVLRISGAHVEDVSRPLTVAPGPAGLAVPSNVTTVDRLGILEVVASGKRLNATNDALVDGPIVGAELVLERFDGTTWQQVGDVRETCAVAEPDAGGSGCTIGSTVWKDLELYRSGTTLWSYRVRYVGTDYVEGAVAYIPPYRSETLGLRRWGEVRGTVRGQTTSGFARDVTQAEVSVVDFHTLQPIAGVDVRAVGDGTFTVGPSSSLPPRDDVCFGTLCFPTPKYRLKVTAEGYEDAYSDAPLTFSLDTLVTGVDVVLQAKPANVAGWVVGSEGFTMHRKGVATEDPRRDVEVTVSAFRTTMAGFDQFDPGVPVATVTTSERRTDDGVVPGHGAFLLEGLESRPHVLRFQVTDSEGTGYDPGHFEIIHQEIDPPPGQTLVLDEVTLLHAPADLDGTVSGRDFDGGPALPLADVTVTAILDPPDGSVCGDAPLDSSYVATTETGTGGTYQLEVRPGTYRVQFAKTGYVTTCHEAVGLLPNGAATVDRTLTAETVDVDVTVATSTADPAAPLQGATVRATYQGPVSPGPAAVPAAQITDATGVVTFSLPPGSWRFSVEGTDNLAFTVDDEVLPHRLPAAQDVTVQPGDGSVDGPTFVLDRYASVSGRVLVPNDPLGSDAGGTSPAEGVAISSTTTGLLFDPATTAESGTFRVWLPQRPTGTEEVTLTLRLDGYVDQPVKVTADTFEGDELDATLGDITLSFAGRRVVVTLTSAAGNASLVGLRLSAVKTTGQARPTVQSDPVTISGGVASAVFTGLEPGKWDVTSLNGAATARLGSPGALPHVDMPATEIQVPTLRREPGDVAIADLYRWAAVTGLVSGAAYPGASLPPALPGAEVRMVQQLTNQSTATIGTTSGGAGRWTVGVRPNAGVTLAWAAAGYEDRNLGTGAVAASALGPTSLVTRDRTLTARPVTVPVDVTTSGDGSALAGVTVEAVPSGGQPTDPTQYRLSAATTVTTVAGSEVGRAVLTLWPGAWNVTTAGTDAAIFSPRPHATAPDEALTVTASEEVGPLTEFVLDPYLRVAGTTTPASGTAISTDAAGAIVAPATTAADGAWTVWLPTRPTSDDPVTIGFTRVGHGPEELVLDGDTVFREEAAGSPYAPATDTGFFGHGAGEVALRPLARDVTVTLTSSAGDASLAGLAMTARRQGFTGVPATVTVSDATPPVATATFSGLAPGDWTVDSTNGGAADRLETAGTLPHVDVVAAPLHVPIADTEPSTSHAPAQPLVRFAAVTGVVTESEADPETPIDGASVAVSQGSGAALRSTDTTTAPDGTWTVGLPTGVTTTLDWSAAGYRPVTRTIEAADVAIPEPAAALRHDVVLEPVLVIPVTVTDSTAEEGEGGIAGATVTAIATVDDLDAEVAVTDDTGVAALLLPKVAATWAVSVAAEDVVVPGDDAFPDAQTITVTVDEDGVATAEPAALAFETAPNSKLYGSVVEVRGSDRVAIAGVEVRARRPGETYRTVSTEPDANGENYRLQARAGTWQISTTRGGETIVVHEAFEIHQDGSDSRRNELDIVLPTDTIELTGQVRSESGAGIEGAAVRAVSTVGTLTASSDGAGRYALEGLDNRVTWAVTFSPPAGYEGRPVTRYIALSGDLAAGLDLDQTLPSGLGTIEVAVTGGEPGATVEVTLSETTPFPTIDAAGRLTRTLRLGHDGAAELAFEDLVPGDGRTIPQDRFALHLEVPGHAPVTRSGLDVRPDGTTRVAVDLGMVNVVTGDVALTLLSSGERLTDADVRLHRDGVTLGPPVSAPGSNVYTFANVEPGTWQVVADGFAPTSITVPDGGTTFTATLSLVALPDEDLPTPPPAPSDTEEGGSGVSEDVLEEPVPDEEDGTEGEPGDPPEVPAEPPSDAGDPEEGEVDGGPVGGTASE